MTAPINLNKARKSAARSRAKVKADENAVRFGRTKAERKADETVKSRAQTHVDGHKRET